jgi:hypothetical protein
MERMQTLLVKKYTLLVDEQWEKALIEKFYNFVEAGEVFQLLDEEEIELCDDCQVYLTKDDGEVVMDVYRCPDQKEFCLNCCGCPGEHEEGGYYA